MSIAVDLCAKKICRELEEVETLCEISKSDVSSVRWRARHGSGLECDSDDEGIYDGSGDMTVLSVECWFGRRLKELHEEVG